MMTSEKLLGMVPVYEYKDVTYVKDSDIPKEYRDEFGKWMRGQTCPVIEGEDWCSYSWDFERWVKLTLDGTPTYWD